MLISLYYVSLMRNQVHVVEDLLHYNTEKYAEGFIVLLCYEDSQRKRSIANI